MIKKRRLTRFKLIVWTFIVVTLVGGSWLLAQAVLAGDYTRLAVAVVPAAYFAVRMNGRAKDA
ncbi:MULTISPECIES: hypothetical protein [Sphingomonas]|uniref:hypothetical protein n=1 Tax=Sphingomonas TaxID=13687 RepID=UPI00126A1D51|nr:MULTISPECIES: hypothetical protein [Sphingomonas]